MARFGAGRNLVRKALGLLQHQGLARRMSGGAWVVAEPDIEFAADTAEQVILGIPAAGPG